MRGWCLENENMARKRCQYYKVMAIYYCSMQTRGLSHSNSINHVELKAETSRKRKNQVGVSRQGKATADWIADT